MDSDNDSYHSKNDDEENVLQENKNIVNKLNTSNDTSADEENNKHVICRPRSVRIGKNCALGLEYGPRPVASGRTQVLWHSFSQCGPPGRQITYMNFFSCLT